MSPRLMRTLLESGLDTQLDPVRKAHMIDEIMQKAMASEQCLRQMDSMVSTVTRETVIPSLNATVAAADAVEQQGGFAEMSRNLREMADITTGATRTITLQADMAVNMSRQVFSTLEDMIARAPQHW